MQLTLNQFKENIARVVALGGIHSAIRHLATPIVDTSDLLRAQVVLAVSALDYFVHEATVTGMLEVFDGVRQPTGAYERFQIPLSHVGSTPLTRSAFETCIREKHGYLSFQRPDKIADAIRLFSVVVLWAELAQLYGEEENAFKSRLELVVSRRNQIAHEADSDPSFPGARWPISARDVDNVVDTVVRVATGIHTLVK